MAYVTRAHSPGIRDPGQTSCFNNFTGRYDLTGLESDYEGLLLYFKCPLQIKGVGVETHRREVRKSAF